MNRVFRLFISALLSLVSPHPGDALSRSTQTTAATAEVHGPRGATITVVRDADQLATALRSKVNNIRLTAHVDLRQYASSAPEAGVIFEAGSNLESLMVRYSTPKNDMRATWAAV